MFELKIVNRNPIGASLRMESIPYIILSGALFIINPTIALVFSAIILFSTSSPDRSQYYVFYVLLACWIGVLNMTKQLVSDQIYYAKIFVSVDTTNILDAIWKYRGKDFMSSKEIVFNIYSVLCNKLTHANPRAYFFILTVNVYLLHFLSLHKILFASNRSKSEIVCAILLMAFFTPFFIQSIHAVRQILAASFVLYAVAYRAVESKNHWFFLLVAFLIHNTTIFFIILALLPQLYQKLSLKQALTFLTIFALFVMFYVKIGILLNALDFVAIGSVGRRLMNVANSTELKIFSIRSLYIYATPMLASNFFIIKREYQSEKLSPIVCISYLSILTFLLIVGFTGAATVQFRYQFYLYSFIPFVLLFPGASVNILQKIYCHVVTFFFIYRFFFVDVDWGKFANWGEILMSPFFHFWNTPYYTI